MDIETTVSTEGSKGIDEIHQPRTWNAQPIGEEKAEPAFSVSGEDNLK